MAGRHIHKDTVIHLKNLPLREQRSFWTFSLLVCSTVALMQR